MKVVYTFGFLLLLLLSACGQPVLSPSVNVTGSWFEAQSLVAICGGTGNLTVAFDLEQTEGQPSVTGFVTLMIGSNSYQGEFTGSVSGSKLTGRFYIAEQYPMDIAVSLKDSKLTGTIKDQTSSECQDGSHDKALITLVLEKVESVPQPDQPNPTNPNDPTNPNTPATSLEFGKTYELTTANQALTLFSFTLPASQFVTLTLEGGNTTYFDYDLMDQNRKPLVSEFAFHDVVFRKTLAPGTYYLSSQIVTSSQATYTLKLDAKQPVDVAYEPNNTLETATPLGPNFNSPLFLYSGWSSEYDEDIFTFSLSEESVVSFDLGDVQGLNYHLFAKGQETSSYAQRYTKAFSKGLAAGTYYIRFSLDYSVSSLDYTLNFNVKAVPEKTIEPNDSLNTATLLSVPTKQEFYLGFNDEDWFTFHLTDEKVVTFTPVRLQDEGYPLTMKVFDGTGKEIHSANSYGGESPVAHLLPKGQYFVAISMSNFYDRKPVSYTLSIETETLPDADLEPNNTRNEAKPLELGFERTLFLTANDVDMFIITLDKTTQLTVDIKPLSSSSFSSSIVDSSSNVTHYLGQQSQDVILGAGTHYLQINSYSYEAKYQLAVRKK
jgi:hypothetical protein